MKEAACNHACAAFTISQAYDLLSPVPSMDSGRAEPRFQRPAEVFPGGKCRGSWLAQPMALSLLCSLFPPKLWHFGENEQRGCRLLT